MAVTKHLAEGLLSLLILTLVVSSVSAQPWLQLDDPPAEDVGDAELAMLVYGRYNVKEPYYSIWNGSEWSDEMKDGSMGTHIRWVVTKTAPNRFEVITGVLTTQGHLYANIWNGSWRRAERITTEIGEYHTYRGFDIAYEQESGDALIFYHKGKRGIIYYRIWNGSKWSREYAYHMRHEGDVPLWIDVASKPGDDEIAIQVIELYGRFGIVVGLIWNGSAIIAERVMKGFVFYWTENHDVAYEQLRGHAVFMWGSGSYFYSAKWDGSSWVDLGYFPVGYYILWMSADSDPNSNGIAVAITDYLRDLYTVRWDGSSWTLDPVHERDLQTYYCRCADVVFEDKPGHEGHIILVWGRRNLEVPVYCHFDGSSWGPVRKVDDAESPVYPMVVQLRRLHRDTIMLAVFDTHWDLNSWSWDHRRWRWLKEHATDLPHINFDTEPFMVTRSPSSIPADKVDLYFYNDGVRGYFNETLACAPDPYSFTYVVYLDKPVGGDYPVDFRMVYSTGIWRLMTEDDEVDPADDVSNNHVDIKEAYATSTRNLLIFKTITFSTIQDGASYYYRVFIDSDQNKSTGYRGYIDGNLLAIGADYLVEYNKKYAGLYQFAGSTQSEWKWSLIGDTDDGRVAYEKEGETLILEIYRDDIGDPEVFDLVYNAEKLGVNADWAPDSYNDTSYHSTYYVKDAWGELQKWDGSKWVYVEDITITEGTNPYSIVFNFSLQGIANPDIMQDTNVWFVEYYGYNQYEFEVDRAPNTGAYFIPSYVIPELPWPAPLIFIPAVITTIYFIYKWKFARRE